MTEPAARAAACTVATEARVAEAFRVLEQTEAKIVLVVGADGRLCGTITDGDTRRGILRGVALDEPVTRIMNPAPVTARIGAPAAALREAMVRAGLRQMPLVDDSGKVVDLVLLSELVRPGARSEWVALMVGGRGSRLKPLTEDAPKPMLAVGDKPILQIILETLAAQGFRRFFLSVHYRATDIKRHFGDGSALGVAIEYLEEKVPRGTAGALSLLPELPGEPLVVMNGDILTKVDLDDLLAFHRAGAAAATMCVREYDFRVPYGVVEVNDHRFVAINEKPVHRFLVNAGIYVLEPAALALIPADGPFDMPDLFDALHGNGREVCVFPIREYWLDVGQADDLARARDDFRSVFGAAGAKAT